MSFSLLPPLLLQEQLHQLQLEELLNDILILEAEELQELENEELVLELEEPTPSCIGAPVYLNGDVGNNTKLLF